ncbi:MAG: hypothetical protein V4580_06510 [Bacteroidota bacterium]
MDFEEFKHTFEIFTKIDTPEKLAICERQYQQEILRKEDEKYFEPLTEDANETSFLRYYENNLRLILGMDQIKSDEFAFYIRPSFEPEGLLVIKQNISGIKVVFREVVSSYWEEYYANNYVTRHKTTTVECDIDNSTSKKLLELLNQTFTNARLPKAGMFVLDGTKFTLLRLKNDKIEAVTKHSPDETSKSGKTIQVLLNLIEYVKIPNQFLLNNIANATSELLE